MAVPFNIPDEQSDVEVMLLQLHTLLNKLSVAIRQNEQRVSSSAPQSPSSSQRVRTLSANRRSRDSSSSSSSLTSDADSILSNPVALPDLLSNLSILASASENFSASSLTAMTANRSPRRRMSSESSYDETKISIMAKIKHGYQQDWNQVGVTLRQIADDFTPTILTQINSAESPDILTSDGESDGSVLSKIMPCSFSSCSLMTAMICFVGWHIFRAR